MDKVLDKRAARSSDTAAPQTSILPERPAPPLPVPRPLRLLARRTKRQPAVPIWRALARWSWIGAGYGALILVVLVVTLAPPLLGIQVLGLDARWFALRVFAVVVLSSFPAFLFVRFVRFRTLPMWQDFVLNLHRLGMDLPQHLPEPSPNSEYAALWEAAGGPGLASETTIYEHKFEAVYGEGSTRAQTARMMGFGHIAPVYVLTLLLAVAWTAVLWGAGPLTKLAAPLPTLTAMAFGFLGAYAFALQTLIRRYFNGDLRPAAYTGLIQRFLFIFVAAYAVHHAMDGGLNVAAETSLLFLIGFFPMTAIQVLRVIAAKGLSSVKVSDMDSDYPLSELDGMSIWAEARFLELAVEDMQNLATANLTDVLLQSRVPVARLIDWIDQSLLLLHIPEKNRGSGNDRADVRGVLRMHGVRAASDLVALFEQADSVRRVAPEDLKPSAVRSSDLEALGKAVQKASSEFICDGVSALRSLLCAVSVEPNLYHVLRWKTGEKPAAAEATLSGCHRMPVVTG